VQQIARSPIVLGPDRSRCCVTKLLEQLGAIDHVGEQERANITHVAG
jgi:hypothetical protein